MTTTTLPEWFTTKEAAEYLRCTDGTVREYLNRRELRGVKQGRIWRIRPEWCDDYLMTGDNRA